MAGYTVICVIVVFGPKFPVRYGVVSLLYILVDLLDLDHLLLFIISLAITYTPCCIGWNYHFSRSFISDPPSGNESPFNAQHN